MKQRSPAVELLHSFLRQFTISVVSFEEFAIMRASFVLNHQLDSQFDFVSYVLDRMQARALQPPPCSCRHTLGRRRNPEEGAGPAQQSSHSFQPRSAPFACVACVA